MEKLDPRVAQQIAQAAIAFQQQRTGHEPQSVAVVLTPGSRSIDSQEDRREGQAGLSGVFDIGVLVRAQDADLARGLIEHRKRFSVFGFFQRGELR